MEVEDKLQTQKNANFPRYIAPDFLQYLCERKTNKKGKASYENKNPKYGALPRVRRLERKGSL
jgi:hypothetical protein